MPNMNKNPDYYRPPSEWGESHTSFPDWPTSWTTPQTQDPWSFKEAFQWPSVPKGMEEYSMSTMPTRIANDIWGGVQGAGAYAKNIWDNWRQPQTDAITQASPWGSGQNIGWR